MLVAAAGLSCGKVGAPVPPARIRDRTTELAAVQRGSIVLLSWPAPALTDQESSASYIDRVNIYRLVERRDEEPVLDPDLYEESAQLIGFIDRDTLESLVEDTGSLQFSDALDLSQPLANSRLRYAIRYVNKRGQNSIFSNTVAMEPVAGVAMPPTSLTARDEAQDRVVISWTAPAANVDGSSPASVVGYNIYRRTAKREAGGKTLNSEPITKTSFIDQNFQYQVDYAYVVRTLSQGTEGLIESADSETVVFKPVDQFAPASPDPVSIASAGGVISLFWPSSDARDVIGYNVYRAETADAGVNDWVRLTDQPVTAVTFRDEKVVHDRRYYYRVTAIDRFNNESDPSRVVSETANP
ncbi:MAG TPA: hypothetical protein VLD57_10460 [Blastocatellia bacterium]|nr:hypothetical protein [Blastocatellia bacterium]